MNAEKKEEELTFIETQWDNHKLYVYLPPSWEKDKKRTYPTILVQDGDQARKALAPMKKELEALWSKGTGREFILVMICPVDRLSEYTPWPGPAMSPRFPDFKGNGNQYLESLKTSLLPWLCKTYQTDIRNVSMLGYSLGGLIGVYALTIQNCWRHVAGICSSFWYHDWISYLERNSISEETRSIYLHYGTEEGKGKTGPMEKAAEHAAKTGQLLIEKFSGKVTITTDQGGHHSYADQRYRNGLLWLNEEIGADISNQP
ncbi:alpha/beta hydrolase [Lacrimispora sp. JR3]|uniref:alpha/beta hydrolase n=1 Tax=Lacrimispora sinapis TaxID=3111456 RepID=UPI003748282C